MTPQELKNSILQLAIQGKLVEQRRSEGTAEELYKQIQAEKQALIKAGKIKKEKPLPEITEDEMPFDIPESWMWVRLNNLCSLISDGTHKTPQYVEKGVPFLSVKDISSGFMDFSNTRFISQSEHQLLIQRCKPEKNDVLICRIGTLGKAIRIDTDKEFSIFVSLGLIKLIDKTLADYIVLAINSGYGHAWIQRVKVGGGTHTFKINLDDLHLMPIPLPPYSEQKRILEKCESFSDAFDRYEQAWSRLEDFNKRFPGDMQKSILQMAIQGKLVEQRPEEGTGEELYQQIQAEKQALIKAGKIKKEKPLPEITEDEIPFEIPENWKWVRIGKIVNGLFAGGDKPSDFTETADEKRKIPVIANGVTNDGILGYTAIPTAKANTITVAGRGTIGFSLYRDYEYCPVVRLIVIEQSDGVFPQYLQKVLQALPEKSLGTSIPQLTVPMLYPKLIPLPPFAEQKRIVARLEELLPLCERLK